MPKAEDEKGINIRFENKEFPLSSVFNAIATKYNYMLARYMGRASGKYTKILSYS